MTRRFLPFLLCLAFALSGRAEPSDQELWDTAQAAVEAQDWTTATAKLAALEARQGERPEDFYFIQGRARIASGDYVAGRQSLLHYFQKAGRQGRHYRSAITLYTTTRKDQQRAERMAAYQAQVQKLKNLRVPNASYAPLIGLYEGSREAQDKQRQLVDQSQFPLEIRTKELGIIFRLVPPGTALLGCPPDRPEYADFRSYGQVTLTRPYYFGKFEVTNAQWKRVMGWVHKTLPTDTPEMAAANLGWREAQQFLLKICEIEGDPPGTYRLPTEAEWEFACRAGTTGESAGSPEDMAWYNKNSFLTVHEVGLKQPNAWGLYDMLGNVTEWTNNWIGPQKPGPAVNPTGPPIGIRHCSRGSSWRSNDPGIQGFGILTNDVGAPYTGLRILRVLPLPPTDTDTNTR